MAAADPDNTGFFTRFFGVFRYSRRAIGLVWTTSRTLTIVLAFLTLVAGVLPAAIAYVGQLIVDGVVAAIDADSPDVEGVILYVMLEAGIVAILAAAQRGISASESLLRAQLGHRVNVLILEKSLTLPLTSFEDSEFYDKLTRARREASSRPLSLVKRTFGLAQNGKILRRCVPAVSLALAGQSHADLPGDTDCTRGQCQRGQALSAWTALSRPLP